jgi:hypothetical protein
MQFLRGAQIPLSLKAQNLRLKELDLKKVALVFEIQPEGQTRATEVPVVVQPPFTSDLLQKRYSDLIEGYLRQQRVKLL